MYRVFLQKGGYVPIFLSLFFWPQVNLHPGVFYRIHNDSAALRIIVGDSGSNPGPLPQQSGALPVSQHMIIYMLEFPGISNTGDAEDFQ